MRHRGGARSEEGPQKRDDNRKQSRRSLSNSRPPARIQPTTFDHFVKRWSSYQNPAVDPARDAELMTRHTGEALRIDDRGRINRSVDPTASQNGFSDPAMLQLDIGKRGGGNSPGSGEDAQ